MPNAALPSTPESQPTRFSITTLFRALSPALAATAIVVYLFTRSPSTREKVRPDGMRQVTLSQKDSSFAVIPPSAGGASAQVLYAPTGPGFHLALHGSGLPSGHRYVLEIDVDGVIYSVASYTPDARGQLSIDTTLTEFREGVCVGTNYDPPSPASGHHLIKIWVKRDGSPVSGTMPGIAPSAPGAQLACHGNGDGKYDYVLLENEAADFTGIASPARAPSR
jgi:hypothetical protein